MKITKKINKVPVPKSTLNLLVTLGNDALALPPLSALEGKKKKLFTAISALKGGVNIAAELRLAQKTKSLTTPPGSTEPGKVERYIALVKLMEPKNLPPDDKARIKIEKKIVKDITKLGKKVDKVKKKDLPDAKRTQTKKYAELLYTLVNQYDAGKIKLGKTPDKALKKIKPLRQRLKSFGVSDEDLKNPFSQAMFILNIPSE